MFISLLTVLFIGLKLAGIIQWSWLWVLAPMWIGLLFFGSIAVGALGLHFWLDK